MRDMQTLYMGHGLRRAVFGTLVLFAAIFAASHIVQAQPADKLSELMKLTGFDTALDNTSEYISAAFKAGLDKLPMNAYNREKTLAGVDPAAREAFDDGKLRRELRAALESKLSKADYAAILAFHKTKLGVRMVALENAAHSPAGHKNMEATATGISEMLKKQPDRVKILKALDKSLGLMESAVERNYQMARAIAIGMLAADERTANLSDDAIGNIDSILEKLRPAITAEVQKEATLSLAYTYRNASVAELRDYVKYLSSPSGKRLYEAGTAALNDVLVKAGVNFGHALMKEMGKERT